MLEEISVYRLTVGMHISLKDVPWFRHPFLRSSFEIRNKSEIRDIVALGKPTVYYDPKKSKAKPLDKDAKVKIDKSGDTRSREKHQLKSEKASELRQRRIRFQKVEKRFVEAMDRTSDLFGEIMQGSMTFYDEAKEVALAVARPFHSDVDLCVNHINASATDSGQDYHTLNVMVLSLMLAQQLEMDKDSMEQIAVGALLHDIGTRLLPKEIIIKPKLSRHEMEKYRQHPYLGVTILSKMPDIDRQVMKVVYQHHEESSGTGYPKGLEEEATSELAQIVHVAEVYERMINTCDPKLAVSPHKALAIMFGKHKKRFNEVYLNMFIKMLGVYPPGTICRFSSGDTGIVMTVDPKDPLHPEVILYDPGIPKSDAIIYKLGVDLDLEVDKTILPADLKPEEFDYLNSRSRIQYFPAGK